MSALSPGIKRDPTQAADPQVATGLPHSLAAAVFLFSGVLFYTFATHGTFNPLYQQLGAGFADDFFRAQAHSMIHGHLSVNPGQLPGECWLYKNKCLGYFGLTPSVLRLPLIAIRSNTDHTLTAVYLTAALLLAVGATLGIIDLALARVPRTPMTRFLGFALAVGLGPGSVLLMLARPAMYEESIAWGTAFALVGIYCFLRWWAERQFRWGVALLVSMVVGANARPTVVPIAALLGAGIVLESLVSHLASGSRQTPSEGGAWGLPAEPHRRAAWREVLLGLGVAVLPVATVCCVYWLKFHTPVPNQLLNQQVSGPGAAPWWLALRRVNHDTLVGLRFVPTDLFAYIRPDGLILHSGFPFIDFRFPFAAGVHYIGIPAGSILAERWSTIPDEMPLAVIAIIVGGLYAGRRQRSRGLGVRPAVCAALHSPMTYCIVGGIGAWGESLMQCGITNRYLADAMPLIVVLVTLSARVLAPAVAALSGRRATAFVAGVTILLIASLLVNVGLEYQDWWHTAV